MNKLFDEKLSEIELPSNKKFGYFFTNKSLNLAYVFAAISITLFFITLVKADLLLYPNKLWIQFGLLLGMVISPIVLGVLFFVLFTPTAIIMKLYGRDELRIKFKKSTSYWIVRENQINSDSFSNQF